MASAVNVDIDVDLSLIDLFGELFEVLVLDDDATSFETVIDALMAVCGHARPAAERLTWQVHNEGSAVVSAGSLEESEAVSARLCSRGLIARVRPVS